MLNENTEDTELFFGLCWLQTFPSFGNLVPELPCREKGPGQGHEGRVWESES